MHQVEQDLILSRALMAVYSDDALSERLAFRGGTALHKLYLTPQARYSEDLDFVQVTSEPIGPTLDRLRNALAFIGEPRTKRKKSNNVLLFHFETTSPPITVLKVKVEINCKEHFTVLGHAAVPFAVDNAWFSGSGNILTFKLEELLGSKLRALYQRRKGRDLFE
jgi:predicted nucleotidyltransferase component of viral defense system